MLPRAMCQTVTRVRVVPGTPGPLNDDGLPTSAGAVVAHDDIAQVSLQPLMGTSSTEANGVNFDAVVDRWRLFAPPGTDLVTTDRIQQGALDLEVDGDPVPWPGLDGTTHHVEAYLKKFGGGS